MARFEVRVKRCAAKEIEAIPRKEDRQRVVQKIQSLADDPRPQACQKLSGMERFRLRQGRYRIVYSIADNQLLVVVVRVGDRKEVYRTLR